MANTDRLTDHLKFEEACNLKRHLVDGKPHIGWGRSLQTKGLSDEELAHIGYEDEDDIHLITQEQADYLFENDIADAITEAERACSAYWETLTDVRQEVLISMAYNLGYTGLRKFRRMHAALLMQDYTEAAKQILDSDAARHQAPQRYRRLAEAMRTGEQSAFELENWTDGDPFIEVSEHLKAAELGNFTNQQLLDEMQRRLNER